MNFFLTLFLHSPMLIILPLLVAAPLVLFFKHAKIIFAICMVAVLISFLASVAVFTFTLDGNVISYALGGFAAPLGIEYRIDGLSGFMVMLIMFCAFVLMYFIFTMACLEIEEKHTSFFYACLMLCLAGLCGVIITGDVFNTFVFLEISSLASYILIAFGARQNTKALKAAWDYLVLGTIGATFFVIGIGLLYMVTGTLNMVDMAARLANIDSNRTIQSAFAFIIVGMGLKAALFPLHRWLPSAYATAPSAVSALLAATATKVALYVIIRFVFSIFPPNFSFELEILQLILLPLGIIAMFVGSALAIYQVQLKRMLAYSSIAQIGIMVIAISTVSNLGLTATLATIGSHAISKAALFVAVAAFVFQLANKNLKAISEMPLAYLAGLGRQMPFTSAAIVIGGISLIGVPSTSGFVAKWVLLLALFENGKWPVAILLVVGSTLTIIYVWKIIETLYIKKPTEKIAVREAPFLILLPLYILVAAIFYFAIFPDSFISIFETIAANLLDGGFTKAAVKLGAGT